ncbi:oligosaccharide flippase family protein [Acinetobacter sp. 479375]|uniref:oligosaccharide flippase family protein n=1 Tax=Acinetobacter TaxID=469 RepID=UPI000450D8D0|nr:polysaccharide biosynthesis family protein [Acinetobacter sp. 479375]
MKLFSLLKGRLFSNSLWMISEKIISIFGLIFVTSFVAKYIGPENFGKLTFAGSLFAIVQTISLFGSESVIFQKTSKDPKMGIKIIAATRIIRNILFLISSSILLTYLYFSVDLLTFIFSVASCIAVFFSLHDVFNIYFNAVLESKINAFCNVIGIIISLILRYIIAVLELNVEYLVIPIIAVALIPFLLRRVIFYKRVKQKNVLLDSKDKRYRSYMMHVGSKLVFYSLSVAIFTKTSQIFLGLKSAYDLGIYTVAATLGTSFYFVLVALISSFMTDIYQEKSLEESQKKVARLNALVIFISIGAFVFFLLFGQWIIKVLYGEQFQQAAQIILWMVVVCLFSGLSTVAEKYLLKFNAYSYLQKKTNVLVVFNIVLAFLIIQVYGVYGAVFAILVTEILSTTIFNYFFKNNIIFDTHRRIFLSSTYKKAGA